MKFQAKSKKVRSIKALRKHFKALKKLKSDVLDVNCKPSSTNSSTVEDEDSNDEEYIPCPFIDANDDEDDDEDEFESISDYGENGLDNSDLLDEFNEYLMGTIGGRRPPSIAKSCVKICKDFLLWTYSSSNNGQVLHSSGAVSWLQTLIVDSYTQLLDFSEFCADQRGLSPSTVLNYVTHILSFCDWFVLFRRNVDKCLNDSTLKPIRIVAKRIRKVQGAIRKALQSQVTMPSMIADNQMPAGGLAELQDAVRSELNWAQALVAECSKLLMKDQYDFFLGLLFASMYVLSVQGRPSGILSLSLGQGKELLLKGAVTSKVFKTRAKYGYQPVMVDDVSARLLTFYIETLRKRILSKHQSNNSPLWLKFDGSPLLKMAPFMKTFFRRTISVNISPTTCRSLVETEMDSLHDAGKISSQERAAVHNINGHTSQVAKDYYVFKDRNKEVHQARNAFKSMVPAPETPAEHEDNFSIEGIDVFDFDVEWQEPVPVPVHSIPSVNIPSHTWPQADNAAVTDWGTGRADYCTSKTDKKAVWTQQEVNYVGRWCDSTLNKNPHMRNVVAKCLAHIRRDEKARPIFHPLHVFDSARLRNGYRTWLKQNNRLDDNEF
jgi:hypothetical protein